MLPPSTTACPPAAPAIGPPLRHLRPRATTAPRPGKHGAPLAVRLLPTCALRRFPSGDRVVAYGRCLLCRAGRRPGAHGEDYDALDSRCAELGAPADTALSRQGRARPMEASTSFSRRDRETVFRKPVRSAPLSPMASFHRDRPAMNPEAPPSS